MISGKTNIIKNDNFTFQSGYIPMGLTYSKEAIMCVFTFQSGYIPMFYNEHIATLERVCFTFQSGYIPILPL